LLARPLDNIILFFSHQSFIQVNQKQIEHKHKLKNTKARHSIFCLLSLLSIIYIFSKYRQKKQQQTNKQTNKKQQQYKLALAVGVPVYN